MSDIGEVTEGLYQKYDVETVFAGPFQPKERLELKDSETHEGFVLSSGIYRPKKPNGQSIVLLNHGDPRMYLFEGAGHYDFSQAVRRARELADEDPSIRIGYRAEDVVGMKASPVPATDPTKEYEERNHGKPAVPQR